MKLKKILVILLSLIVVVIVSTLLHYQNMNYISENWNIDFPSENTIVYQVKPSPSFTNDGIYYEVQEVKNKKLPLNTHKTQVCHKYIFNGTLLNRQQKEQTKIQNTVSCRLWVFKKLPITLSNKKNNEIEEEFNKYIIEAKVSEKQLPDFTQDYKYYKKSDVGRSLIVVAQDQLLYIVSYNL